MNPGEHGRRKPAAWDDLDALVLEEMEALGGRPRERRGPSQAASVRAELEPHPSERYCEPADLAFEDEEAFIERTVDYLRERPDADALLEAIRTALSDDDPAPVGDADQGVGTDHPLAGSAEPPPPPAPDETS